MAKQSRALVKRFFVDWSPVLTALIVVTSAIGYYLGTGIKLKLTLTDLLPENHPSVIKFEKLTDIVGGVGYFAIVLKAEDGKSHEAVAPTLVEELKKSPLVRSAFFQRERRFFADRLLYYGDVPKLQDMEASIEKGIQKARSSIIDLGLYEDEEKDVEAEAKPVLDKELVDYAKRSANITENLISKDRTQLLIMVKPIFDSTDLEKTKQLVELSENLLKATLPSNVAYEFAERYYGNLLETKMVESDIMILGSLSLILIASLIYLYLRNIRTMLAIFIPVLLGMGITVGITRLMIGHINIITGFLMGIVSGLGVDYGIHLALRLRLEKVEPSSDDPDPIWRTLASSGHSVFVGAFAASLSFFFLCLSSFRAFSEFGFICGIGILSVLFCLLATFSTLTRLFNLDTTADVRETRVRKPRFQLPQLKTRSAFYGGVLATIVLLGVALRVQFEYEFDKMLQFSQKMRDSYRLVDSIYGRSAVPSAIAVSSKEDAVAIEKLVKEKYMPRLVNEVISGATIVPEDQEQKEVILKRIQTNLNTLQDKSIERVLEVPASVVRGWVAAKPFRFTDLPPYTQNSLRGTEKTGYLVYVYPAVNLNNAKDVREYAGMLKEIEALYPTALLGSDAIIFSDILDLIQIDGSKILAIIVVAVLFFIWVNIRRWDDTLLSYLPLLVALPVGMGLMVFFGVKFNIFNIAIIPTFVAMGIDVPIHIVHRMRETGSGLKAARDLASSINLALLTAAIGFGVLIFARAGVLRSLGAIALLGTAAIWWVGLIILPAFLEHFIKPPPSGRLSRSEKVEREMGLEPASRDAEQRRPPRSIPLPRVGSIEFWFASTSRA